MKTNREWLESLSHKELALFLTAGLHVCSTSYIGVDLFINISRVATNYTHSVLGIEKWLSMPQEYEVVEVSGDG